ALVTALVQSSSAVTVATIGFVNAGILTLRQALVVVFGASLGTTMTGWLVSLTGVGFKIDAFALPILAVGIAIKLTTRGRRLEGLGGAIAGFGLFFLGLAILKEAFGGLTDSLGPVLALEHDGLLGLLAFVALGFATTLVTQSSSAAIAIVLTAASQSVIGLEAGAAAVVGANIGTTSTSALAALGATANARRVAVGHFAFNATAGAIGLLMLPLFAAVARPIGDWLGIGHEPPPLLALFHTVFNVAGLVVMLPLSGLLARRLERLMRSAEEDLGRPRYLDRTVLATPSLALVALEHELSRLEALVCDLAAHAARPGVPGPAWVRRRAGAVIALGEAIAEFATSIRMESLHREESEALARALRIARYLEEAGRMLPQVDALRQAVPTLRHEPAQEVVQGVLDAATRCIAAIAGPGSDEGNAAALAAFEPASEEAKSQLLISAAALRLPIAEVDATLDAMSGTRRLIEQIAKADRALLAMARSETIDETEPSP
ncbi:MAG: Na/Pi cotransporter family protein, partial [Caulobacter sp.]|nr:Na/Pi cotransporter family protein [Caulobacter sp.]